MPTDTNARRRFPFLHAAVACVSACLANTTQASLWESRDWALSGTLTATTGYDSNLTFSHDGPEDVFVQAKPQLTLGRRNSTTDFHADAIVTGTEFLNGRQPGQTDYLLSATYAYPTGEKTIPRYKSEVSWQRSSEPDIYLGNRILHTRAAFSGEGYVPVSGKLGVRGEADVYADNFAGPTTSHNRRWRVFAGLAHEKRPGLQTSLNVGFGEGRSRPNRPDISGNPIRSTDTYVTARIRGEITAKLTGSVYGGFGQVRYKGGYSNRNNLPVAGADLTWGIDPRRTVVLAAYSGADYAPDGQSVNTTRAFLSFTHVVIGHWQYIVRGGPTHVVFRREVRQSTDNAWEGGLEFAYKPSERFRVAAGVSAGHHDSDARERRYDRTLVSLESAYRF